MLIPIASRSDPNPEIFTLLLESGANINETDQVPFILQWSFNSVVGKFCFDDDLQIRTQRALGYYSGKKYRDQYFISKTCISLFSRNNFDRVMVTML